ncbi:MAG: hypothetical protein ACLPN6_12925 [Streptosporangiaceae bacterium]|jgi:hypothetical protein
MNNGVLIGAGILITIAGLIWALQGFGVVGGSFMSGDSVWAIIGPLVALAGLSITGLGLWRRRAPSR